MLFLSNEFQLPCFLRLETNSTMDFAKEYLPNIDVFLSENKIDSSLCVFASLKQNQGRGRGDSQWFSPDIDVCPTELQNILSRAIKVDEKTFFLKNIEELFS
ncbi:MAG: hypothetical protein K2X39_06185, partial [Silvanigrellaceae bacterium]|nr:hypothetical protein [Silvanigrellaceae bacterium]